MLELYDLKPVHENVKSYYGNATVEVQGDLRTLYSYGTAVASWNSRTNAFRILFTGKEMQVTTARHMKEFALQHGVELHLVEMYPNLKDHPTAVNL